MPRMAARVEESYKQRMREIAAGYRQKYPWQDNLGMLEGLGAKLRFVKLEGQDGAYDPEHNVVFLNPKSTPERQRFTLAHEISHALLLQSDDLLSDIHDSYEGEALEDAIEILCNVGASAMLISKAMLERVTSRGLSGASVYRLMLEAEVSASVAMVSLSEYTDQAALFALCVRPSRERGNQKTPEDLLRGLEKPGGVEQDTRSRLEVRFAPSSRSMVYTLAHGTPIPPEHPIQKALETGIPLEGDSYIPFRSGSKMPAWVSAYPERGRVFAVFLEQSTAPTVESPEGVLEILRAADGV